MWAVSLPGWGGGRCAAAPAVMDWSNSLSFRWSQLLQPRCSPASSSFLLCLQVGYGSLLLMQLSFRLLEIRPCYGKILFKRFQSTSGLAGTFLVQKWISWFSAGVDSGQTQLKWKEAFKIWKPRLSGRACHSAAPTAPSARLQPQPPDVFIYFWHCCLAAFPALKPKSSESFIHGWTLMKSGFSLFFQLSLEHFLFLEHYFSLSFVSLLLYFSLF